MVDMKTVYLGQAVYKNNMKQRVGIVVEINPLHDNGFHQTWDYQRKQNIQGAAKERGAFRVMWHDGLSNWNTDNTNGYGYAGSYSDYAKLINDSQARVDKLAEKYLKDNANQGASVRVYGNNHMFTAAFPDQLNPKAPERTVTSYDIMNGKE